MALNRDSIAFLVAAREAGVSFENTLMLGRQFMLPDERALTLGFADAGQRLEPGEAHRIFEADDGWSEPLFRHLGAKRIDSVDASSYEGATIVHDLNTPLPDELRGRYSAVVDGGTLEHVFNFPIALRSALEAVSVGGHYLACTPANNHFGHGFYQLSPELYYRVLTVENGYRVRCMLMSGYHSGARWFQVADPAVTGHRTLAFSTYPVVLYVLGVRVGEEKVLGSFPQQSDYVVRWSGTRAHRSRFRKRLSHTEPIWLKDLRHTVGILILRRSSSDFRSVRLADFRSLVDAPSRPGTEDPIRQPQ